MWDRTAPPRNADDAAFLTRYESWSRWFIAAAALVPLLVPPKSGRELSTAVGIVSWLIFLGDYIVQSRSRIRYLKSRTGAFDLVIVVLTSPWYMLPGVNGGGLIVLLRLARLLRIILVARGARRLIERLGRAALVAAIVVMLCSWVAYRVEQPVNPQFATYGDALWWGYVTLTTVGYGDIVPITLEGRLSGVAIMTVGIGLLGVLAGTLSSFFKLTPSQHAADEKQAEKERKKRGIGDPADPKKHPPDPPVDDSADIAQQAASHRHGKKHHGEGAAPADSTEPVTATGTATVPATGVDVDADAASGPHTAAAHKSGSHHKHSSAHGDRTSGDPVADAAAGGTVIDDPSSAVAIKALSDQIIELREHIKDLNDHIRGQDRS